MNTTKTLLAILIVIGLVLVVGVFKNQGSTSSVQNSILERVKSEKTIRVGYAAYPPYVAKNLNTGELSGFYIDIMNEMASRAGWKVEWVETTWQTFISDLQTGKFDVIDDPMFATIPRWAEINFTSPLGYFSGVAGLTQKNEFRFSKIQDLNKAGITIAVPQGWTSQEYANKHLPLATIKVFPGDTAALALADAITGNSDVALADGLSVEQYIEKNPNQNAKTLFLDNPPAITPAAWGIRKGDVEWLLFLNGSIDSMRADGTLKNIAEKYKLYSYEVETKIIPQ